MSIHLIHQIFNTNEKTQCNSAKIFKKLARVELTERQVNKSVKLRSPSDRHY